MRSIKPGSFLLALSLALSGLALGCNREPAEPESDRASVERGAETRALPEATESPRAYETEDTAPPAVAQDPEVQPQQRVVVVQPEPGPDRGAERELNARERRLAQRQAELDARERHLRDQERRESQARAEKPARPEETEEAAPAAPAEREERSEEPAPSPEIEPVTVPAGTVMEVEFLRSLSSETSSAGDTFRARIASDLTSGGAVVVPAGSEVVGVVTEAVPLRKVGGRAKLALKFTDLVLPSGATVPIHASFLQEGRSETRKDAATIGGAAAGGAVLGRILSRKDRSKGAVIGAIIGAAAGTAIASRTPGEEVTIPEGTAVNLKLDDAVEIRPRR
jgi:type IV secretory pathway VirB10-like protein